MLPFQDLLRNLVAELLCHFHIHMSILKQHAQGLVPCGGLELQIGSTLCCCVGTESVSHVMRTAICDVRLYQGLLPCFFDVDGAKGCFAGEDERLLRVSILVKLLQFFNDWITESNTARRAFFGFLDECNLVGKIYVSPLEIENFALARARCQGDEDKNSIGKGTYSPEKPLRVG